MSEQSYSALPDNFRKWKENYLEQHPTAFGGETTQMNNLNYLKSLAFTMKIGDRCQLDNGARGTVRYIGKVIQYGCGYFIGIELDQADSNNANGFV